MSTPKRIQRQRTKGWRMPEGAVYVGRPTHWGNPFRGGYALPARLFDEAVRRDSHRGFYYLDVPGDEARYLPVELLRGRDLACWCPLDQPCHADVLLELANA